MDLVKKTNGACWEEKLMSHLWTALVLAVALSLDGLGVGVSYGIRKIRIPLQSLTVICLTSALAMTVSMVSGHAIGAFFSALVARRIGAAILIGVALWILAHAWRQSQDRPGDEQRLLFQIAIPPLGVVVQILREPHAADLDQSGEINLKESAFLGAALAMDSFGAGFGAALAGFSLYICPLTALIQLLFVSAGLQLGKWCCPASVREKAAFIPGLVILAIGLMKIR
jgi:putative sporulation protein YtaF